MILPTFDPKIAKDHFDTLMGPFNAKQVKLLVLSACPAFVEGGENCAKRPSELLGECETKKEVSNCEEVVRQGVEDFCKVHNTSPACEWLVTTTTGNSTTLFIIIGAVVGAVLILAIAIGLFFYCRKKKKLAGKKGQGTTGTTDGGASGTSGMSATTSGRSKKSTMI